MAAQRDLGARLSWLLLRDAALAVLALMTALWLWSLVKRDASVVDPFWSIGFLLITLVAWLRGGGGASTAPATLLLLALVSLWALRLWLHLTLRARGKPEDPRYQAFRRRFGAERYWWVSFFQVFLLQGALMLVIAAPLLLAMASPAPGRALAWNHFAGAALALGGLAVEAVADAQLGRFRNDPGSRGRVLDRGLWRWSRHPNYFGEAVVHWGFWLFALDARWGAATVFAPALMTFMLLRVSGVSMLEPHLVSSRPGYADYVRRTSAFVPWPPRRP